MVITRSTAINWSLFGLVCVWVGGLVGCAQKSKIETPPPKPITAEERFDNFITALKEQVETRESFSSLGADNASASTSWEASVSHQLIPAADGKPMRAVLSIHRKSEVTVLLPEPSQQEALDKSAADEKQLALAKEFIPELVESAATGNSASRIASSSIRTLPDQDVSRFEMQYNGERWEILTPLNENEKPFTASAIKMALERQ